MFLGLINYKIEKFRKKLNNLQCQGYYSKLTCFQRCYIEEELLRDRSEN